MFYITAAVAAASTVMAITRTNAVHGLLYFTVSLFAAAVIFYLLGAPFVAVLELIIYAGAIIVLFVFVVMVLNRPPQVEARERQWVRPRAWAGPALLALVLAAELGVVIAADALGPGIERVIGPVEVGSTLLGPYLIGVELTSMLLLAGLVGAYHLGRRDERPRRERP